MCVTCFSSYRYPHHPLSCLLLLPLPIHTRPSPRVHRNPHRCSVRGVVRCVVVCGVVLVVCLCGVVLVVCFNSIVVKCGGWFFVWSFVVLFWSCVVVWCSCCVFVCVICFSSHQGRRRGCNVFTVGPYSQRHINKCRTLAHAQTIHYK